MAMDECMRERMPADVNHGKDSSQQIKAIAYRCKYLYFLLLYGPNLKSL